MILLNVVISDPENGKAYTKKIEDPVLFLNKKIGENVSLTGLGLQGYEAKITGGSDLQGFPMHPTLSGQIRKKIYSFKGVGFKQKTKGERRRKSVRGNTVSKEIAQLNLVITKRGTQPLHELMGAPAPKEQKVSAKDELIKKSMETVGNVGLAMDAKRIKGKVKG